MIASADNDRITHEEPTGNRSDSIKELATALCQAQAKFGPAMRDLVAQIKSQKANYSYKYVDLARVFDVCREPLAEYGLAIVQTPRNSRGGVVVNTMIVHSSGEYISGDLEMPCDNTPQSRGSAITYARRYALMSMLGIAASDEDDDGAAAERGAHSSQKRQVDEERARRQHHLKMEEELDAILPAWAKAFGEKSDAKPKYWAWVRKVLGVETVPEITLEGLQKLRHVIEQHEKQQAKPAEQQTPNVRSSDSGNPITELCDLWAQKTYRTPGDKQTKLAFIPFARAVLKQPELKGGDLAQLNDDGVSRLRPAIDSIDMVSDLVMGVKVLLPKQGQDAVKIEKTGETFPKLWLITTEKHGRMACPDPNLAEVAEAAADRGDAVAMAFYPDGAGNRIVGLIPANDDQQGAAADAGAGDVAEY